MLEILEIAPILSIPLQRAIRFMFIYFFYFLSLILLLRNIQVTEEENCGWEELAHDALDWIVASSGNWAALILNIDLIFYIYIFNNYFDA